MLHFRQKAYLFKFKLSFSLLCLFLLGLCITLGVWQLHRYNYKKTLLTIYQKRVTETPKEFKEILAAKDLQFQSVKVQGRYLASLTFLIQNRFYHDQPGFEVLTPLEIPGDEKLLLVDRGWIKEPDDARLSVTKKLEVKGHIKLLNEYQFILGDNILQPEKTPHVAQRIDMREFSQVTHRVFYPFILRLNANEMNGFVREWTIVTVPPARHMVYAVQWFLLGLVLLIAYGCFCCEEV